MLGVDFGHRVQHVAWRVGVHAFGQGCAIEGHAFLDFLREQRARLQEQQLVVEVAKGILGLQVQCHRGTGAVPLQRLLDTGQQVIAPHQELHRLVEHVEFLAQGVLEDPGQSDHTLFGNFHRRIVAV